MAFNLNDKYTVTNGKHVLTGLQAIVKLCLLQKLIDEENNLSTRGFVSGYRGSPLGSLDLEFLSQSKFFEEHGVDFHSGLNEDLALTAVWGTQQIDILSTGIVDGVYGVWYGKGPGVNRSGDALMHANFAGTHPNGGVLVFAGDDHNCKSSTFPHQSDTALSSWYIPMITPANVEDVMRMGLMGFALSRYSGLYCGVKIVADLADSFQTANVDLAKWMPIIPQKKFDVSIRWPDPGVDQEARIHEQKLIAVQEFLKYNTFNEIKHESEKKTLGLIAVGKSYTDTLTALDNLGIGSTEELEKLGISILKIGLSWPLQESLIEDFIVDHENILVIEEKEGIVENQIKQMLYGAKTQPKIYGKNLLRKLIDLDSTLVGNAIADIINLPVNEVVSGIDTVDKRTPHFCSGCPHNISTQVPEGSIATAGIGCHYMAWWMDRGTKTVTHMGAEGSLWIGANSYTEAEHMFANLGDGTYWHSGSLSIRAAVAAKVNVTFKILFNKAVAMTGGQALDGDLTARKLALQLQAEGVKEVFIVTPEQTDVYDIQNRIPSGVEVVHRDDFMKLQERCRDTKGVTAIIYDQWCATEKRRKIKRGEMEAPAARAWINSDVCEGCGDCSKKSNCLSVESHQTELGTKRRILQESCNQDLSCVTGYCPSFLTVYGGERKLKSIEELTALRDKYVVIEKPIVPKINSRFNILLAGIGGLGIVSSSHIIGVAAHLQNTNVYLVNQTGLAQKFGAVTSMITIGDGSHGKMGQGTADLLISCDAQTSASDDVIPFCSKTRTKSIINSKGSISSDFIFDRDWRLDTNAIAEVTEKNSEMTEVEASHFTKIFAGDTVTNMSFLLGIAYQKGLLPIEEEFMFKAIELNGAMIEQNKLAWMWGRFWAYDKAGAEEALAAEEYRNRPVVFDTFEDSFDYRKKQLIAYQSNRHSKRYSEFVGDLREKEKEIGERRELSDTVMRQLHKLMSYKDEYEVARLHVNGFDEIKKELDNIQTIKFNLSLPWNRKKKTKTEIGSWILHFFKILQRGKFLRGTPFDPFGWNRERRLERKVRDHYIRWIKDWTKDLTEENYDEFLEQAWSTRNIRGFGYIKTESIETFLDL